MLVPLRAILEATDKYDYAQGAFNVNAVAKAKAAIEVHEMFRSAAILQGADLANGFMGGRTDFMNATLEDKIKGAANIGDAVKKYGENSPIPVALHLDHGRNFESCKAAIAGGYTSAALGWRAKNSESCIEKRAPFDRSGRGPIQKNAPRSRPVAASCTQPPHPAQRVFPRLRGA